VEILLVFGLIVVATLGVGKGISIVRGGAAEAEAARLLGCATSSSPLEGHFHGVSTQVALSSRISEITNTITVTMVMPDLPVRWRVRSSLLSREYRGEPLFRDELMAPDEVMRPRFANQGPALVHDGVRRLEVVPGSFVVEVTALRGVKWALELAASQRARVLEAFALAEAKIPMLLVGSPFRESASNAARDEARRRWRAEVDAL